MTGTQPEETQRDLRLGIVAELDAAGFEDAEEIGHGGFGVVYKCQQPALDRTVAIKVLTSDLDDQNIERFLREQRAMGKLSGHPNIVHILQPGVTPTDRFYIVMPFHARGSLEDQIRRDGPLAWPAALRIGVKMAGALETAHRAGILHRDVKPANILLSEYGEPELTDFGIAHVAGGGFETGKGIVTGSPAFTAPEVLSGRPPTAASDVYSLGATLFCLVTGHAAFQRRTGEKLVAQFLRITTQPVPDLRPDGIPNEVCSVIERAMSVDPGERFATAAEFGAALRELQRLAKEDVDDMAIPAVLCTPSASGVSRHSSSQPMLRRTDTPPPSALTKYRPPTPARSLVARARLIDMLRAGGRRRLIVIHGPVGFGKSILAAQWREVLVAEGVTAAWLTIDGDDNNVVWFLAHLIEAVRSVAPSLANELRQALEEHGTEAEPYVLASLINEIHETGTRIAIILDDWHRITDVATIEALAYLLDRGCHHLQVVVTSRTRAGLPMSRMRVRDELIEIDAAALRFDLSESRAFLVDLGGLSLDESDVANLEHTTDGWVAALQLASLSLRDCDDFAELISHMSGRHHAIGEYLAENVLDSLEPDMLDFLMATSITERISGDLASALAGVSRAQALLEEAEDRDLFLHRLDEERVWFRYHHLFAEFLQRRLERDQPGRVPQLHATASRWFADHKLLREAVDHAMAAGEEERAIELIELQGIDLLEHSQMSTLLALVSKLPPHIVALSPRLQLCVGWANMLLQRPTLARAALDAFESAVEKRSLSATDVRDMRTEADVLRVTLECSADHTEGVDELVAECLSRPETLPPWLVCVAANAATVIEIYRFDFEAVRRWQEWVHGYQQQTSGPFAAVYGHCLAGIAANEELNVAEAERRFREALRLAKQCGGTHSHAARLACALLGELLYERGDVDEAERLIEESCQLGSEGGIVDFMIARYTISARLKAMGGDCDAAGEYLDDGARVAAALGLPRLRAHVDNERMRLGLPVAASSERLRSKDDLPPGGVGVITAQLRDETEIRGLLAGQPDLACRQAQAWVQRLQHQGRPRALLQASRLLAACLSAAGRTDEAKQTLASLAAQCAELGLVRYLLDGGPELIALLAALRDDLHSDRWNSRWPPVPSAFLDRILNAAQPISSGGAAPQARPN
jgi:serine/threonine-protein kinase PknK